MITAFLHEFPFLSTNKIKNYYVVTIDQISIKTPNPKCRLVFNRVYRLDIIQSFMLLFSTPLVNYCATLTFSLVHLPPPPLPCVNKYGEYVFIHCITGGGVSDRHLPPSTFTGRFLRKADI
jgi:hypothetical protein